MGWETKARLCYPRRIVIRKPHMQHIIDRRYGRFNVQVHQWDWLIVIKRYNEEIAACEISQGDGKAQ